MNRLIWIIPVFFAGWVSTAHAEPLGLSGKYAGQNVVMLFEEGKCYVLDPAQTKHEMRCERKTNFLYLEPPAFKQQNRVRQIWIVYEIFDDRLASSYMEDMQTGQVYRSTNTHMHVLLKQ